MSGLYYFLSIVAVYVVFTWYIRNDEKGGTIGLLAVKPDDPNANLAKKKKTPKKWTREGAMRR